MFGNAAAYERYMGRWSRRMAPELVEFTGISGGGRALDLGSGTGSLAFAIAERFPDCQVTGVDPSAEFIAYAQERNAFGARASFETGDARGLKFDSGTFQSCVSLLALNFIPDREGTLRETMRVTKPGGRIGAAVWDYGWGMEMLRAFWDAAVSVNAEAERLDERHLRLCRAGELADLWRRVGLKQVEEGTLEIAMQFDSFADYWEPFLLGQGPAGAYAAGLNEGKREELRGALIRRLGIEDEEKGFRLKGRAWAVAGTRAD